MQAQSRTSSQRQRSGLLSKLGVAALICSLGAATGWQAVPLPSTRTTQTAVDSSEIGTALCRECRITLDSFAVIGGRDARIPLAPFASLGVTSKGEIIVGAVQTDGEVSKVSSQGHFEGTLNRTGSGPGELPSVTHLAVGSGDTVFVIDAISRLMNRVTTAGKFLDQTFLPGGIINVLPIGGRRLFASANVPARAAAGYPLHVLDKEGVVASFGNEVDVSDPYTAGAIVRNLARGPGKTAWVANRLSYRIESWTLDGRRMGVLTRTVRWFPPSETPPVTSAQLEPPQSTLLGVMDSGDGYLWVYISVADPEWKAVPLEASPVPGMFKPAHVLDPFVDTVIEVIDLRQRAVIASYRDGKSLLPIGGGYLSSYEEDSHGKPTYRIWRPRMSRSTLPR